MHGESLLTTGMVLAAMSACAAFTTPLGGRWAGRQGRWLPAVTGAAPALGGTALLAVGAELGGTAIIMAVLVVLGIGLGVAGAPVQTAAVEPVPQSSIGSASGVYSTSRYIGSVVGSSVLAMVFARQPDAGDAGRFVALFAALALVVAAGVVANAHIASREAPEARALALQPHRR